MPRLFALTLRKEMEFVVIAESAEELLAAINNAIKTNRTRKLTQAAMGRGS